MAETKDIIDVLDSFLSESAPKKWAKLSSDIQYRRLQLLLLKDILLELRRLNGRTGQDKT